MYDFKSNELTLRCINLTDEIKKNAPLLTNNQITIFNSSVLPIKNSNFFLVASRGWYGNIRSWDGINFVILSIFNKNYKKIRQNIIDINKEILKEKKHFSEFKNKVKMHKQVISEGPEDPRLFYYDDEIYMLINEIDDIKKDPRRRLMYILKIDIDELYYKTPKFTLCETLSTNFEKNWGSFVYKNKLHMLYDINPLKIIQVDEEYNCKIVINKNDNIISKIEQSFGELNFHLRNSTNLIPFGKSFLGLGHAVLDYKENTDLNKFLIPALESSKYDKDDKEYFKRYFKLYLGFFFCIDMDKKEITKLSPFFQLPSQESKQDLIFFPTTIYEDNDKFVNISYSLGDNRSYVCKLHIEVIKTSLYNKHNIDMHMNYNINSNYYLELLRTLRILNNYQPTNYSLFVNHKSIKHSKLKNMKGGKKLTKKRKNGRKKSSFLLKKTHKFKEKVRKSVRPKPSILKPPSKNLK